MSVDVATTPTFKPGLTKPLFVALIRGGANTTTPMARWDISSDGQRFLINTTKEDRLAPPITVLLNWTAAFRRLSTNVEFSAGRFSVNVYSVSRKSDFGTRSTFPDMRLFVH